MLIRGSWKIQGPDIQQWLKTAQGLSAAKKDDIKNQTPALGVLPIYLFIYFPGRQVIYADNYKSALFCENTFFSLKDAEPLSLFPQIQCYCRGKNKEPRDPGEA